MRPSLDHLRTLVDAVLVDAPQLGPLEGRPFESGELEAFEARQGVALPADFRAFLEEFGDSAMVPRVLGHRAAPLAQHDRDPVWRSFGDPMAAPFPFEGTEPLALEWDEEADDYVDPQPLRGTLCLGSAGCDLVRVLVVTGPARGSVWTFAPSSEAELEPMGQRFLPWCCSRWEAIQQEQARLRAPRR